MSHARHEGRSGSELVFASLRALMNAYQLWGAQSSCHLTELSALLQTSEDWLWGVMAYLDAEGLVTLDRSAGTVSLTPSAAHSLMRRRGEAPAEANPEPPNATPAIFDLRRPFTGRS